MVFPLRRTLGMAVLLFSLMLPVSLLATGVDEVRPPAETIGRIRLATTTSTDNSGLLADILPVFTASTSIEVDVIAVGTGRALELGRNGDVDVVLVHAREQEDDFVAQGFGVNRRDVMHNDFVVLGPPADPAGIGGGSDAVVALAAIARAETPFISRGDDSGTHIKERFIWVEAGGTPTGEWYREAGQGMGAVLTIASEVGGYTLADRATWLAMRDSLDLSVMVEGDPRLFNPYGIIAVNPDLQRHVEYLGAMVLIAWMTSPEGQQRIGEFTVDGELLFIPDAANL